MLDVHRAPRRPDGLPRTARGGEGKGTAGIFVGRHHIPAPAHLCDLAVTDAGPNDILTFTAPGYDWNNGTAAKYELRRSSQPITQDNFASASAVDAGRAPKVAGSRETLTIPHVAGMGFYAIRAIDAAGNIGPVQVLSGPSGFGPLGNSPPAKASARPNTAAGREGGVLVILVVTLVAMLAMTWAGRRLTRHRGVTQV